MSRTPVLALALAVLAALGACEPGPVVKGAGSGGPSLDAARTDPIDFGALPDFRLLSAHGKSVTLASLLGRPLVIGALYTTCSGPCPSIVRGLLRLQEKLQGTDVHIVVVSVDPEIDTPQVLARYAERIGADPERWTFLTGAEDDVYRLVREGFFMPLARAQEGDPAPGEAVTHDKRLLAVDRGGRRRGWYDGTDQNQLEKLRRRLVFLASEESPDDARPQAGAAR